MPMIARVLTILALVISPALAQPALEDLLRNGQQELHQAKFPNASETFRRASVSYPTHPAPVFFQGLVDLWQLLYFGYDPVVVAKLTSNARAAVGKAEAMVRDTQASGPLLWRAMSRSLLVAAALSSDLLKQTKEPALLSALRRMAAFGETRAARADFRLALQINPKLHDARLMLVLLGPCLADDITQCIESLWKAADDPQWVRVEVKYVLLSLLYGRALPEELATRAIPLVLGLHVQYPSNGLFHVGLAKMYYEAGNREECKAECSRILRSATQYAGAFHHEARYFLGVIAFEDNDCRTASRLFGEILNASPRQPDYLVPWSNLRAAQCEITSGNFERAIMFAQNALKSANGTDVRRLAEQLLSDANSRKR